MSKELADNETVLDSQAIFSKKSLIVGVIPPFVALSLLAFSPIWWVALSFIVLGLFGVAQVFIEVARKKAVDLFSESSISYSLSGYGYHNFSRYRVVSEETITRRKVAKALIFNEPLSLPLKTFEKDAFGSKEIITLEVGRSGIKQKKTVHKSEFALWNDAISNAKKLR